MVFGALEKACVMPALVWPGICAACISHALRVAAFKRDGKKTFVDACK
jgi:hypothetical protein